MTDEVSLIRQLKDYLSKAEVNKSAGVLEAIDPDFTLHKGFWDSNRWGRMGVIEAATLNLRDDIEDNYTGNVAVTAKKYGINIRIVFEDLLITPDFHKRTGNYAEFKKENELTQGNVIIFQVKEIVDCKDKDYIVKGTYKSTNPNDHGTFEFSPTKDTMMDKRPSHSKCTIM